MPNLLGLSTRDDAAAHYRLHVPLRTIGCEVAPLLAASEAQIAEAEAVVLTRLGRVWQGDEDMTPALLTELKACGKRLILDLDDDLTRAQHLTTDPAALAANLAHLQRADLVTCTSPVLARVLRPLTPAPVRVVPNYVRADWWPAPTPPPASGPIVIVLAGSPSHDDDWRIVETPLRRIKARYGSGVALRMLGYCPPYLADLADEYQPWLPFDAYPAALAGAHIGLCPLPQTAFNVSKSPIKAYEFALSGLAVIGSPCQYGPVLAERRGIIAHGQASWERAMQALIEHPAAREDASERLHDYVLTVCDARPSAARIARAYEAP